MGVIECRTTNGKSINRFLSSIEALISHVTLVHFINLFYSVLSLQLVKMFAVIVLLFAINYFPVHVFNIIQDVFPKLHNFYYIKLCYLVVMLFAMSNCCHSPIIYCWMNAKYRQGFRGVFECIFLAGMCRGKGCGPKIHHQKPQVTASRSIGGDSTQSTYIRRTPIIKVNDTTCHSVL